VTSGCGDSALPGASPELHARRLHHGYRFAFHHNASGLDNTRPSVVNEHAPPPGVGQSRLARRLTTILPDMTLAEAIDTTRIPRVAGLTGDRAAVVTTWPFRAPPTPSRMWA
jgi:hypothetical protein